ncbi:response regulator [Polaribacter tangerinus]|uniref:response regulator n=1 Tax=Polaribacter tangerinus TaxID=1920034 RepID=UPI000B4BD954|nr:response regulator [Polaribacter tangerinus]
MEKQNLKILLIDDDPIEALKFNRAVSDSSHHKIEVVTDGDAAMEKLETFRPNIILLDLNMPLTDGIEFLGFLKSNDSLRQIPVIILTTSDNDSDLRYCYNIGIAGYMIKPLSYEAYEEKIRGILNYWSLNNFVKA